VSKQKHCWESNIDVFPIACGNLINLEKEAKLLILGTKSEKAKMAYPAQTPEQNVQ
jgi:hypothetical protein